MSDVKEVGVIGQKYEDRTTGKVGTLDSRDDKCKTLMLIDSDGKGFNVSYSSFRSKWRKVKDDEEEVTTSVESVDEVVEDFNSHNKRASIVEKNGIYSFIVEEFNVMTVKPHKDGTYAVECFPDVYIDSETLKDNVTDFKCSRTESGLDLKLKVGKMSFATLVNAVKDAIVDINLYAYITE